MKRQERVDIVWFGGGVGEAAVRWRCGGRGHGRAILPETEDFHLAADAGGSAQDADAQGRGPAAAQGRE